MLADELYKYTYITMYLRTEQHVAPNIYSKYETNFKGFYDAYWGYDDDEVVIFGCKTYQTWGDTTVLPGWPGSWPSDANYGLCMKGWINTFEIYPAWGNWDGLFNAQADSMT